MLKNVNEVILVFSQIVKQSPEMQKTFHVKHFKPFAFHVKHRKNFCVFSESGIAKTVPKCQQVACICLKVKGS